MNDYDNKPGMMVKNSMTIVRPTNAGTKYNLPEQVRNVANARSEILAWTALDPALEDELDRYLCCRSFGVFAVLPCFWPHLLILWPCLCSAKIVAQRAARSQYWILTEQELRIVTLDYDACCCPGVSRTGNVNKTIPLENITDAGLDARGSGMMNQCVGDMPTIYVDTASSGNVVGAKSGIAHEAVGLGLANYDWFIHEILNQRDIVKNGGLIARSQALAAPVTVIMDSRGGGGGAGGNGNRSAADRIKEISELRDQGVLTETEFQKKRQDIIDSI